MTRAAAAAAWRLRRLGRADYAPTWAAMQRFTAGRGPDTPDELWWVEHPPVFTQGLAGRPEHLIDPGGIPVVHSDRGGQVTYHGPGQIVMYLLVDLARQGLGVRPLVRRIEEAIVACLARYGIEAAGREDAPGVYVAGDKIASLGLRIRRGCSYHGLALNVAMDLEPFRRIHPCGFEGLRVTQIADRGGPADPERVGRDLAGNLTAILGYTGLEPLPPGEPLP